MSDKPNILWLMTDEQRTDSLGCYESPWAKSPYLDKLAREGVLFKNAVTPAPVCQPARAALLTGQYPSRTGVWYNIDVETPKLNHLVHQFANAGYRTASFGKNHYDCSSTRAFQTEYHNVIGEVVNWSGYAEQYNQDEFDVVHYPPEPYPWILGGTFPERMDRTVEADVVRQSMKWLDDHPKEQPFFLRLSFNAPHTPVIPPYPFDKLISAEDIQYPAETEGASSGSPKWVSESLHAFSDSSRLNAEEIKKARQSYYGEAAFADYQFGVMLGWMREQGYLENTIVVFLSDHGTHIGDYGLVQKQTFYNPVVNVPFFFWYPKGISAGLSLNTPVETISLLPTLLELVGLPIPDHCDGVSLAATLYTGKEPQVKPVFSEFTLGSFGVRHDDKLVMVRHGEWKLSLCVHPEIGDGALYNLTTDPYERYNLYGSHQFKEVSDQLTRLIEEHLNNSGS